MKTATVFLAAFALCAPFLSGCSTEVLHKSGDLRDMTSPMTESQAKKALQEVMSRTRGGENWPLVDIQVNSEGITYRYRQGEGGAVQTETISFDQEIAVTSKYTQNFDYRYAVTAKCWLCDWNTEADAVTFA